MTRTNFAFADFEHVNRVVAFVPAGDSSGHVWVLFVLFLIPTRISSTSFNFGEHFVFEICAVPTGAIEVGFVISEWYLIAYE